MRGTLALAVAVACSVGCLPPEAPKEAAAPQGKAQKVRKDAEQDGPISTYHLWEVYATDAVAWRERYAGRYVLILLTPPYAIRHDDGVYHVLQGYQNGTRHEGVAVVLRDADAGRLSRISRGEEKVPREDYLCVKALAADERFAFTDGTLALVPRH